MEQAGGAEAAGDHAEEGRGDGEVEDDVVAGDALLAADGSEFVFERGEDGVVIEVARDVIAGADELFPVLRIDRVGGEFLDVR